MMRRKFRACSAAICAMLSLTVCGCTFSVETNQGIQPETTDSQSEAETDISISAEQTQMPDTVAVTETDVPDEEDIVVETEPESETPDETETPAETETSAVVQTETEMIADNTISDAELRSLFEENLYCMRSIFMADHLTYSDEAIVDDHIYKVSSERFNGYAEFADYVRSVYCTSEADRLLYNYPYENTQIYVEVDGVFCIDSNYANAKAYFVDWSDMELTIDAADPTRCEFSVTGHRQEPSDVPVQEEYTAYGAAVSENGRWVLEKMIY